MSNPSIRIRGARASIPSGKVLGRVSAGTGEVEVLGLDHLTAMGVATTTQVQAVLPSIPDGQIMANISGATAQPVGDDVTAVLDHVFSNTRGSLLYRGASAWLALAPGTSGQVLTMGASDPGWVTGGGGGSVSITGGTGITVSPSPITGTGSVAFNTASALTYTGQNIFNNLQYFSRAAGTSPGASAQAIASFSGDTGYASVELYVYGATPELRTYTARGSHTSPTGITNGTDFMELNGFGYDSTGSYFKSAVLGFTATESWGFGAHGARAYIQTTPTGSNSRATSFLIQQDGSLFVTYNQTKLVTPNGSVMKQVSTVAGLPAAGTEGNGACRIVTDANATTLGTIVAGGGTNRVPVNSDGTNWRIG